MINIAYLSKSCIVRRLDGHDIPDILALCRGNSQFYRYARAQCTSEQIKEDMTILPPGKQSSDKYYIGFFADHKLTAVMDLIDGYPDAQTAFIGFFMVHANVAGKGFGSRLITEACASLKEQGFARIRLCIDDGNPQSLHFWTKNGFTVLKTVEREERTVLLAEKGL